MASKTSAAETELLKATKVKPKAGETRQVFLGRLHKAARALDDDEWDDLDDATQSWVNKATKAFDAEKPFPLFEGEEPEDADDEDEKPAKKAKGKAKAKAESDDDDDGEDDEPAKPKGKAAADDSEDADEDDAEDEVPAKKSSKKAAGKKAAVKKGAVKTKAKADEKPAKSKAKAAAKPVKSAKADEKPAKKAAKSPGIAKGSGYEGHREGSRRELIHELFDEEGREVALKKAAKLGLAESTPRTWISQWVSRDKAAAASKKKK